MDLEHKLTAIFLQYKSAPEFISRNNQTFAGRRPVMREQLEEYLSVEGRLKLNDSEEAELVKIQDSVVAARKRTNEAASILDLWKMGESESELREFVKEIPKGALLHVHPSGTRSKKTVREILETLDPKVDVMEYVIRSRKPHQSVRREDVNNFKPPFPIGKFTTLSKDNQNLYISLFFLKTHERYAFSRFDLLFLVDNIFRPTGKDIDDPRAWEKTYNNFATQCKELNVSYVEFTEDLETKQKDFNAQINALSATEAKHKAEVVFRWNMAFKRFKSDKDNLKNFKDFVEVRKSFKTNLVRGIDLLASEYNNPGLERAQMLYLEANKAEHKLHQTMHAGELCRARDKNPRDAIFLGSERMGHGVKLIQDRLTMEYNRRFAKVGVVANVVSNQILKSHEDIGTHPFLYYLRLGIPTSLSTDNPGIFQTDIAEDYYKVLCETDINYAELKQLAYNGLGLGFMEGGVRSKLLANLDTRFEKFEKKWSAKIGFPTFRSRLHR